MTTPPTPPSNQAVFPGPPFVCMSDEAGVRQVIATAVLNLWDTVNTLTRLRPSTTEHFWVTIFGSARIQPGSAEYEQAKTLARRLADLGCGIASGGGPGLMQAANEGAASAGNGLPSLGVRVDLPFEQQVNPYVDRNFDHKTFFTRLHQFALMSDAFIVVPGGIGTVLELFMVWQLLQVEHIRRVPLVLVGDMWPPLIEWARCSMLTGHTPLAGGPDMVIPQCVTSIEEAVEIVRLARSQWKAANARSS